MVAYACRPFDFIEDPAYNVLRYELPVFLRKCLQPS